MDDIKIEGHLGLDKIRGGSWPEHWKVRKVVDIGDTSYEFPLSSALTFLVPSRDTFTSLDATASVQFTYAAHRIIRDGVVLKDRHHPTTKHPRLAKFFYKLYCRFR